ncbi:hypothetical protein B5S30_g4447 [[Candida] boidinii]|nr:hypothetical protein B5S30_g4447 [[Candida] boidinii]
MERKDIDIVACQFIEASSQLVDVHVSKLFKSHRNPCLIVVYSKCICIYKCSKSSKGKLDISLHKRIATQYLKDGSSIKSSRTFFTSQNNSMNLFLEFFILDETYFMNLTFTQDYDVLVSPYLVSKSYLEDENLLNLNTIAKLSDRFKIVSLKEYQKVSLDHFPEVTCNEDTESLKIIPLGAHFSCIDFKDNFEIDSEYYCIERKFAETYQFQKCKLIGQSKTFDKNILQLLHTAHEVHEVIKDLVYLTFNKIKMQIHFIIRNTNAVKINIAHNNDGIKLGKESSHVYHVDTPNNDLSNITAYEIITEMKEDTLSSVIKFIYGTAIGEINSLDFSFRVREKEENDVLPENSSEFFESRVSYNIKVQKLSLGMLPSRANSEELSLLKINKIKHIYDDFYFVSNVFPTEYILKIKVNETRVINILNGISLEDLELKFVIPRHYHKSSKKEMIRNSIICRSNSKNLTTLEYKKFGTAVTKTKIPIPIDRKENTTYIGCGYFSFGPKKKSFLLRTDKSKYTVEIQNEPVNSKSVKVSEGYDKSLINDTPSETRGGEIVDMDILPNKNILVLNLDSKVHRTIHYTEWCGGNTLLNDIWHVSKEEIFCSQILSPNNIILITKNKLCCMCKETVCNAENFTFHAVYELDETPIEFRRVLSVNEKGNQCFIADYGTYQKLFHIDGEMRINVKEIFLPDSLYTLYAAKEIRSIQGRLEKLELYAVSDYRNLITYEISITGNSDTIEKITLDCNVICYEYFKYLGKETLALLVEVDDIITKGSASVKLVLFDLNTSSITSSQDLGNSPMVAYRLHKLNVNNGTIHFCVVKKSLISNSSPDYAGLDAYFFDIFEDSLRMVNHINLNHLYLEFPFSFSETIIRENGTLENNFTEKDYFVDKFCALILSDGRSSHIFQSESKNPNTGELTFSHLFKRYDYDDENDWFSYYEWVKYFPIEKSPFLVFEKSGYQNYNKQLYENCLKRSGRLTNYNTSYIREQPALCNISMMAIGKQLSPVLSVICDRNFLYFFLADRSSRSVVHDSMFVLNDMVIDVAPLDWRRPYCSLPYDSDLEHSSQDCMIPACIITTKRKGAFLLMFRDPWEKFSSISQAYVTNLEFGVDTNDERLITERILRPF